VATVRNLFVLASVTIAVALAGNTLARGDDETPTGDDTGVLAPPEPTSEETMVDSWFDVGSNQVTEVWEYEYDGGLCTRLVRYTVPYFFGRSDDPEPGESAGDAESMSCEAVEEESMARDAAGRGTATAETGAAIAMRATVFDNDVIIYPRLRSDVARIEVRNGGATMRNGVPARVTSDAAVVEGRADEAIAHIVVAPTRVFQVPTRAAIARARDEPPAPVLSAEMRALTVVAYDESGRALDEVPVFGPPS
jgi:hypothetical protein